MDTLRTQSTDNFFADILCQCRIACLFNRQLDLLIFKVEVNIRAFLCQRTADEVHLRGTDKSGNENVAGTVIQVLRSINLLDNAVLHNDDTGCHGHSLDLVVGNVDKSGTDAVVQLGQLGSHGCTELCVQVGQRLVKQEYHGVTDDCTSQRNTLFLTAGQSLRLSVEQVADVKDAGSFFHTAFDFFLRRLVELQTECHVFKHGHMRIQGVVLEHHCNLSVLRGNIVDQSVTDIELTFRDFLQTRNHTQGCRFSATGRTDQYKKLLVLDFKVKIGYGCDTAGIFLENVSQGYACHV